MNILCIIFGGLDHAFLADWPCSNLRQVEWGPVVVDELHDQRDVASQITAQFVTGKTWRDNGVGDRKKAAITYRSAAIERLESSPLGNVRKGYVRRHEVYNALGWADIVRREYVKSDLTCPSLFDTIPDSQAVYVPSINPEPSWALGRNILDPRRYPDLGVEGALDLRDKNYAWRRKALMEALEGPARNLLVGQFQFLDSTQHLYLTYTSPHRKDLVEKAYWQMDAFAAEIKTMAAGKYDRVLFVSDNGAARPKGTRPTHFNRPFYSVDAEVGLERPNLRDFYDLILDWTAVG